MSAAPDVDAWQVLVTWQWLAWCDERRPKEVESLAAEDFSEVAA